MDFFKIVAGWIGFFLVLDVAFRLINESSGVANITGLFILTALVVITFKTKFFTEWKLKK